MTEGAFTGSGFRVGGMPRERPGDRGTGSCSGGGRDGVEMLPRSLGLGGIGRLSVDLAASRRNSGFGPGEIVRGGEGPDGRTGAGAGAGAGSPLFMFSNLALREETGFCQPCQSQSQRGSCGLGKRTSDEPSGPFWSGGGMMTVELDGGAQGADTHYTHVFKPIFMSPSTAG